MELAIPQKKVELHLHLDGAVRHATAWELAQKKGITIPGVTSYEQFKKACLISNPSNLWGFLQHIGVFWPLICGDLDALERVAYELCMDLRNAGVIYAEIRYSPYLALGDKALKEVGSNGLDQVISRISLGLRRGEQEFGVKTRTILCALYNEEANDLPEILRLCQTHYQNGVVAIDLCTRQQQHGIIDEAPFVEPIVSVFKEASQTSVHRTIHAEASGSQAIYRAVYQLGSERVGHGYHIVEDEELYKRCVRDQVHFECCPYSSLMTGSVQHGGPSHPIVRFARDGANFSVSSDDPTLTGHYIDGDYELLASWGLTEKQMTLANINAASSSFLEEQEKVLLMKELRNRKASENDELLNTCDL